jgi:septum formation protein
MQRLILGSQSPRRKEILSYFSIPFEQVTPPFVEEAIPFLGDPVAYVEALSKGKAESLHHAYPKATIITADTVVYCEGKIYNKPTHLDEAYRFISELAGHWHSVFTGVTLSHQQHLYQKTEETRVLFNPMTRDEIHKYLAHVHWADKAGGYSIQTMGNLLLRKIDGCYTNVVGFPINAIKDLFLKIGIDLWNYLK